MTPQIALSKDFMESYSRLPRPQQKKVREFIEKFRRDPTQSGINFERLEAVRDQKVRSVRIDQSYRAIVIQPPKGDVYLCVWVDHHDEAYRWAKDKCFEVNPTVGTFQLYELVEEEMLAPAAAPAAGAKVVAAESAPGGLLASIDDEDLLMAGIPIPLLASVRALEDDASLDQLAPYLPEDAAEMLYLLVAGFSLVEAMEEAERSKRKPEPVDVEDFGAALSQVESKGQFKLIESEEELDRMLDAPLEQWRIFLHPTQRKLVEIKANGPVRVLGGAGTGKTVALMHRARYLAQKIFTSREDRLLVTTFTRNLALDLKMNLENLCGEEMLRLDIVNLHGWAAAFMRRQGHSFRIVPDQERGRLFETAVNEVGSDDLPLAFYVEEWDQVVQSQDVSDRDAYFTARRVGRGTRLSRRRRADVWRVLSRYRELLNEQRWIEWQDAIRETRLYIEKQGIRLPYRAVLADEAQDFTPNDLRLLRAIAPAGPNDLFLVGDGHQRIYAQPVRMGSCGIEIRGRSRRLKVNYRTTEQIRDVAVAILEGCDIDDLDGGLDSLKGYCSLRHGPAPRVRHFAREADEAEAIVEQVRAWLASAPAEAICVAARTGALLKDRYERVLQAAGVDTVIVERDPAAEARRPGVRLATMHRMKGLEFSRVILAGVQDGMVPLTHASFGDDASHDDHELRERCLLYVASTRARDELLITGYGAPSPFLKPQRTRT